LKYFLKKAIGGNLILHFEVSEFGGIGGRVAIQYYYGAVEEIAPVAPGIPRDHPAGLGWAGGDVARDLRGEQKVFFRINRKDINKICGTCSRLI
jgi:hypothetical protein